MTTKLTLIVLPPVLPANLDCATLSQSVDQENEEYWAGKPFTARWSEPVPCGPLNFNGTISGYGAWNEVNEIADATARVHGPPGGCADIDMMGESPRRSELGTR